MKTPNFIIFTCIILLFVINCTGDLNNIDKSKRELIEGSWLNKQFLPGRNDTLITIYSFYSNDRFEITEYKRYQTHYSDTFFYEGNYRIPKPGLIFLSYEYFPEGEDFLNFQDTIIFRLTNNDLQLCRAGHSHEQISGQRNALLNGNFYRVMKFGIRYTHILYHFTSDTIYYFSTESREPQYPNTWLTQKKYKYEQIDCFIDMDMGEYITRRGYIFFNANLILAQGPRSFIKMQ